MTLIVVKMDSGFKRKLKTAAAANGVFLGHYVLDLIKKGLLAGKRAPRQEQG